MAAAPSLKGLAAAAGGRPVSAPNIRETVHGPAASRIQRAWKGFKRRFSRDKKPTHPEKAPLHQRRISRLDRSSRLRQLDNVSLRVLRDMVAPGEVKQDNELAPMGLAAGPAGNGLSLPAGSAVAKRQWSEAVYDDVKDPDDENTARELPIHTVVNGLVAPPEPSDDDKSVISSISSTHSSTERSNSLKLLRQRTMPLETGWVLTHEKRQRGSLEKFYALQGSAGPPGAFGQVFFARELSNGKERAVKVISKRFKTAEQLAAFGNEIAIMLTSDHPNVIKALDAFETREDLFIVMEACHGGDLCEHLDELNRRKQRYSESEIARILRDVLMGLRYLHKHKWGHFDLKPDNIMFESKEPNAPLKLIDFGMSRFWNAKEREVFTSNVGTIVYNAPEVLNGEYNIHADMWSVGVVAFMMLYGYAPFTEPDACGTLANPEARRRLRDKIQRGFTNQVLPGPGPWFPQGVLPERSPEVRNFIEMLLQTDVNKRLTVTEALEHPWLRGNASTEALPPEVIRMLHSFEAKYKFQQHALRLMVDCLSENELHDLKEAFSRLDKDHDNRISIEEFYTTICEQIQSSPYLDDDSLRSGSWDLQMEQLEATFHAVDMNKDGFISYDELLLAVVQTKVVAVEGRMREMFRRLRKPNAKDDKIHVADLVHVLGVEEHEAKDLISEADKHGKQEVDYENFLDMWRANARRAPSEF